MNAWMWLRTDWHSQRKRDPLAELDMHAKRIAWAAAVIAAIIALGLIP